MPACLCACGIKSSLFNYWASRTEFINIVGQVLGLSVCVWGGTGACMLVCVWYTERTCIPYCFLFFCLV